MIRRPPRSTQSRSSAASDVYKRQHSLCPKWTPTMWVSSYMYLKCLPLLPGSSTTSTRLINQGSSWVRKQLTRSWACLLYTSDAADDLLCVDLGGRRIIKKKKK